MYNFPINKCPKCGSKTFDVKQYISGYGTYTVDMESGDIDCDGLYDSLSCKNVRKYAICSVCRKRLFKIDNELNVID